MKKMGRMIARQRTAKSGAGRFQHREYTCCIGAGGLAVATMFADCQRDGVADNGFSFRLHRISKLHGAISGPSELGRSARVVFSADNEKCVSRRARRKANPPAPFFAAVANASARQTRRAVIEHRPVAFHDRSDPGSQRLKDWDESAGRCFRLVGTDVDDAILPVEVRPVEPKDRGRAEAGERADVDRQLRLSLGSGIEQLTQFVRADDLDRLGLDLWLLQPFCLRLPVAWTIAAPPGKLKSVMIWRRKLFRATGPTVSLRNRSSMPRVQTWLSPFSVLIAAA
jgi:hypothetical protein